MNSINYRSMFIVLILVALAFVCGTVTVWMVVSTPDSVEVTRIVEEQGTPEVEIKVVTRIPDTQSTVSEYTEDVLFYADMIIEGLENSAHLYNQAADDGFVIYDSDWGQSVIENATSVVVACDSILELEPPSRFQDSHDELVIACDNFKLSSEKMIAFGLNPGVSDYHLELLDSATEYMNIGTEHMTNSTELLPDGK